MGLGKNQIGRCRNQNAGKNDGASSVPIAQGSPKGRKGKIHQGINGRNQTNLTFGCTQILSKCGKNWDNQPETQQVKKHGKKQNS